MRLAERIDVGSPLPPLGDVLDFMRLLWAVDHALQRTSKNMETRLGVTGPQRFVLRIVGRFPGIPAGQVATLLHLHPSTLTGVFRRLEKQELLRRRADPRDGRRFLLSLTDKGRLVDVELEGTVEAAVQEILEQTPPAKLEAARDVLQAVAAALSARAPRDQGHGS
jgi:MarR family transcriptional regulator, organic hydroperoxide resistance regulator